MIYSDEFVESIKNDPVKSIIDICDRALEVADERSDWTKESHEVMQEAFALLFELNESKLLSLDESFPVLQGNDLVDSTNIYPFLKKLLDKYTAEASKLRLQSLRSHFRASLGNSFAYEFSQGDLDRVQELINSLREQITSTHKLELEHQQRLLRRLEKLQTELHKKVSDLDRFWGLIGDAGVVLGKLGKDAKPIVDRIREIADIVWQTQSRAEELPSGTNLPFLEHKPHSEDK